MYFAFVQVFNKTQVPYQNFNNPELISRQISDDLWVVMLKESVRPLTADCAFEPIGLSSMNSAHFFFIDEFAHSVAKEIVKLEVPIIPEWILCRE